MATKTRTRRNYDPAAAEAKREAALGSLTAGIDALTRSGEWQRYLDMQAKLHTYSFRNTMLILMQRPDATMVMPYGKADGSTGWLSVGRHVRKGETGMKIFVPSFRKTEDDQGEKRDELVGFIMGTVFDISQTDGDDLPEANHLLDGQDETGLFAKLAKVAASAGFPIQIVDEIAELPEANGICEPGGIRINGTRSPAQQAKSAAHELAHGLLHVGRGEVPRWLRELEAESVAYVVCAAAGLDTSGYSFGYIADWAEGDPEVARKAIEACGKRISDTAQKIIRQLEAA
jgi:N-terminal domain of anti-restriction factor ArdC/IrrE N-terminal-like domain